VYALRRMRGDVSAGCDRDVAGVAPVPERRAPIIRRAPSYTPPDIGGLPAVRI
jgi:hypothetical protein